MRIYSSNWRWHRLMINWRKHDLGCRALSLFKKAIFIRTDVISVEQIKREGGKPKLTWSVVVVKGSNCFRSPIVLTMNNQLYIYQVKGLVRCCVSLFAGRPFAVKFITALHFQTWKAFITSKKFSRLLWCRATQIQMVNTDKDTPLKNFLYKMQLNFIWPTWTKLFIISSANDAALSGKNLQPYENENCKPNICKRKKKAKG